MTGVDAIASYGTKRGDLDFYIEAATWNHVRAIMETFIKFSVVARYKTYHSLRFLD